MNAARVWTTLLAVALLASACSGTRPATPAQCAVMGAVIGTGGGIAVGAEYKDDTDSNDIGIGAGIGAVAGALTGYAVCALMPEGAKPAPAAPPPAPVRRTEPVVRKKVVLPGVNFALDKSEISARGQTVLNDEVVSVLEAEPKLVVRAEGYTDSLGSDAYNQALSERRAGAVKTYLLGRGIAATRVEAVGYGESRPVASNETEEGRAQNRRVEIKVLEY